VVLANKAIFAFHRAAGAQQRLVDEEERFALNKAVGAKLGEAKITAVNSTPP